MAHDDVIDRLRALAGRLPDEATVEAHLDRARVASDRGRRHGRVAVVLACLAVTAAPATALALGSLGDPHTTRIAPSQLPNEEEFSCTGPPPFAGQRPEGDTEAERSAQREAEAEAFEAWREANCPDDEDEEGAPPIGDECSGPPPFAGSPAEPADPAEGVIPSPRSEEATTFAETRQTCASEDEEAGSVETPSTAPGAPPAGPVAGGPPEGVPAGPPSGVPAGPPDGVPGGPPAGVPGGPPAGVPAGPPAGVPGPGGGG